MASFFCNLALIQERETVGFEEAIIHEGAVKRWGGAGGKTEPANSRACEKRRCEKRMSEKRRARSRA